MPEPPSTRSVALITGAARRLGAATARALHAAGYDLALHYRDSAAEMEALAAELEARRDGSVLTLQADLAEFDRLPELVARAVGRYGRLDALVNNASTFTPTLLGLSHAGPSSISPTSTPNAHCAITRSTAWPRPHWSWPRARWHWNSRRTCA